MFLSPQKMMFVGAALLSMKLGTHCLNPVDIEPHEDFDMEMFSGEWYRVGLAFSSPWFLKFKHLVMISKGSMIHNSSGDCDLTMWSLRSTGCHSSFYLYEKTDVHGKFTYFSKRHNTTKDITVVESNFTEYSLAVKYKDLHPEYTQVSLLGREPTLRPELIEKFQNFSRALGFSEEAILLPRNIDPCPILDEQNFDEIHDM